MSDNRPYEAPLTADARRSAPAALRNQEPIRQVLADWLPPQGTVLEIASGTGEHAVHFARSFPDLLWQPSDRDPLALQSIAAWVASSGLPNLRPPFALDVEQDPWPVEAADALLATNMVHISPWAASLGLIAGASRLLPKGGSLILYGPWLKEGIATAPSNLAFDQDLKSRNPEWGLRRVEDFVDAAAIRGLGLTDWRQMPANNLMLLFRKES